MGRYYGESGEKEEVFSISTEVINKVKRENKFKHSRVKALKYSKSGDKVRWKKKKGDDPFPGRKPVDKEKLEAISRGEKVEVDKIRTKRKQKEFARREAKLQFAEEQTVRSEVLLAEEAGYLEGDSDEEFTGRISQTQIKQAVDPVSAAKSFDLNLKDFGPYRVSYTRNGRYMLLGGRKGHIAAFDWNTKELMCELSAMESVHAVQWLHTESLFAVAQKKWTYVYDNQGIEIHCLKSMDHVTNLEFLPYHFLLASCNDRGNLVWLDVSVGKIIKETYTKLGRLDVMCQNPSNAVLMLGHSKGIVTMWTPNMSEPAGKMLVHKQPVRSVAVDRTGNYMATSATDRTLKIWDLRAYKCLHNFKIPGGASSLQFSQKGLLGVSFGNRVEIYPDPTKNEIVYPYMKHEVFKSVSDISFCPYEDVLGIGHGGGFSSILVPGSGEPNFDALEANPYQTVKQRKEAEVKMLLDKVAPELITLDGDALTGVDAPTLEEKTKERNSKIFIKPSNIEFDPRHKMKGKGGSAKRHHIRKQVIEQARTANLKKDLDVKEERREGQEKKPAMEYKNVLDRFKS